MAIIQVKYMFWLYNCLPTIRRLTVDQSHVIGRNRRWLVTTGYMEVMMMELMKEWIEGIQEVIMNDK